jgi:hypothetical protein
VLSPPTHRRTITTFTNTDAPPLIKETSTNTYQESIIENNRSSSRLSVAQQTMERVESPAPSLINRTTDEFLRNVPFKINTFQEVGYLKKDKVLKNISLLLIKSPNKKIYVQHHFLTRSMLKLAI